VRCTVFALVAFLAGAGASAVADDALMVQPAERDVSPPGVMPIPAGPLVRELVPPPPPEPPRWHRYFLPQTPNAATLVVPGMTIRISGVAAPPPTATCATADGGTWPCGTTALFALRRFLHGSAVDCYFPHAEEADEVVAPCRAGGKDMGLWLLQNGWARTDVLATEDYRAAEKTAACTARGLWRGTAAPGDCPANTPKS